MTTTLPALQPALQQRSPLLNFASCDPWDAAVCAARVVAAVAATPPTRRLHAAADGVTRILDARSWLIGPSDPGQPQTFDIPFDATRAVHVDGGDPARQNLAHAVWDAMRPLLESRGVAFFANMSPRQTQIVEAVARGLSTKQVAAFLGISHHTVNDHLKAIHARLGVASRGELLAAIHGG